GWLPVWLRWASRTRAAAAVNALAAVRPVAAVAKRLAGLAAERKIPRLAGETFSRWWRGRRPSDGGGDLVVLWPDTFTEHLSPSVGRAAVRVLEAAGLRVALPPTLRPGRGRVGDGRTRSPAALLTARRGRVCCGLTYVSTGQLERARSVLRRTLDLMEPVLATAAPVVVLEPSCAAALRTDLPELLHDDPRAAAL
ncbi:FAD-binding oxidoreductase, partial [Streptomyces sp. TRM76130]|nr:FAD-binding oxidoreductase [Streptomyces sp. TRM76130]